MPIKTTLTYTQMGKNLEAFKQPVSCEEIPFKLLECFGASDTIVKRYKNGMGTVATFDGLLIKKTVAYRAAKTEEMSAQLEEMKRDEKVRKAAAPILLVCDGETLMGYDTAIEETYENKLSLLYTDYEFFSPIWGVGKYRNIDENPADVKAAEKMAKLHDEIRRENEYGSDADLHDLNIFMTRLLFCFFAEDTGIFEHGLFTDSVKQFTKPDASDLSDYLATVFNMMENPRRGADLNKIYSRFPYVNGGLFSRQIAIPRLNMKARKLMLECGGLDWGGINPDIFGSMIQAVINPELRGEMGMHYTSVPNIKKLINPLFMDELYGEFAKIERVFNDKKQMLDLGEIRQTHFIKEAKPLVQQCNKLLGRISRMKFFDPACGSGNFLIITYKLLRFLENKVLKIIKQCTQQDEFFHAASVVTLKQFYGIELDDFACETATLSLWLAEHQMNSIFSKEFNVVIDALPLKTNTHIHHGNACRIDWNEVCPHQPEEEVFVMGNPPYLGSSLLSKSQQEDRTFALKALKNYKKLDYISIWFYLGAKYVKGTKAKYALVSTNSICQGEMVEPLWGPLLKLGMKICFAHTSFIWSNNARQKAKVTCIIVGLTEEKNVKTPPLLYTDNVSITVTNINPYLIPGENFIVSKQTKSISGFPPIAMGCKPVDGGNLILSFDEKNRLLEEHPTASKFIKELYGADDFINGKKRYCLWISDKQKEEALSISPIKKRVEKTKEMRLKSPDEGARKMALKPHQFREFNECDEQTIVIPSTSSIRRTYIPISNGNSKMIVTNSMYFVNRGKMYLLGILTSKMNMLWVKTIGGRLKMDYRYTSLCYNTFPFPTLTEAKKREVEDAANAVLDARDYHCEKTLAELYDPDKMPNDLRQAHRQLDLIVDSCYQETPFENDEERLECLFRMYERMGKSN